MKGATTTMKGAHVVATCILTLSCALLSASCLQDPTTPPAEPIAEAQQPGSVAYCSALLAACVANCWVLYRDDLESRAFCIGTVCKALYNGCRATP
jgi:hypothetical protein